MEKKVKKTVKSKKVSDTEKKVVKEIVSQEPTKLESKTYSIKEALAELRKNEKRKFVQTVDLIINLQKFDSRKESLNSFVSVPNPYEKNIAAFLTKKVKGVDVILKDSFETYKNLRDAKRVAKKYDMFIAAAPIMGLVATKFGRALGPSGKMPSPQLGVIVKEDEETIKALVEKMKKSIKIRTKERVIKLGVGKEDMADDKIEENIKAAIKGVIDLLPLKKDNVRNVLIKFTMTPAVKVNYEN